MRKLDKTVKSDLFRYIGIDEPVIGMPYTWLAREVAAKDKKAIIAFDLFDKEKCVHFLSGWWSRNRTKL
jgi:hypothetical protein